MKIQVLKIGIPSKGRLKDKSLKKKKKNKINIRKYSFNVLFIY